MKRYTFYCYKNELCQCEFNENFASHVHAVKYTINTIIKENKRNYDRIIVNCQEGYTIIDIKLNVPSAKYSIRAVFMEGREGYEEDIFTVVANNEIEIIKSAIRKLSLKKYNHVKIDERFRRILNIRL